MWNSTLINYVIQLILLLQGVNVIEVASNQLTFQVYPFSAKSRYAKCQKIDQTFIHIRDINQAYRIAIAAVLPSILASLEHTLCFHNSYPLHQWTASKAKPKSKRHVPGCEL